MRQIECDDDPEIMFIRPKENKHMPGKKEIRICRRETLGVSWPLSKTVRGPGFVVILSPGGGGG